MLLIKVSFLRARFWIFWNVIIVSLFFALKNCLPYCRLRLQDIEWVGKQVFYHLIWTWNCGLLCRSSFTYMKKKSGPRTDPCAVVILLLTILWLSTLYYFVYWQNIFFSWGKSRTSYCLCPLCHSIWIFLVVYLYIVINFIKRWYQQKLQCNIFLNLLVSVYFQLLTLVHCLVLTHLVGNHIEQDKTILFPENYRDVFMY